MTQVEIPSSFGWVVLVAIAAIVVVMWKGFLVGSARKRLGVKYPTMYLPEGHKNANEFNCTQRAHQNTLENLPQFFVLLFLGGLQYPLVSAIGGAVFLAGRVFYALGYSTGEPEKRMRGTFGYLGFFTLLFSAIAFGLRLLGVIA